MINKMDFDGDAMFGVLSLDNWTTDEIRTLAPHYAGWKLSGPRQIGENMALPKPVVSSIVNYLYNYDDKTPDPTKLKKMNKMFTIREYRA